MGEPVRVVLREGSEKTDQYVADCACGSERVGSTRRGEAPQEGPRNEHRSYATPWFTTPLAGERHWPRRRHTPRSAMALGRGWPGFPLPAQRAGPLIRPGLGLGTLQGGVSRAHRRCAVLPAASSSPTGYPRKPSEAQSRTEYGNTPPAWNSYIQVRSRKSSGQSYSVL